MTTSYRFQRRPRPRARLFSKIAPILATGFGFVAFALIVPSNTSSHSEARIFTQGLTIQIDRTSPAYAALEDTLSADTQPADVAEAQAIALTPAKALTSASVSEEPVALKIVRDIRREESLLAQERAQRLANSRALIAALSRALPAIHPTRNSPAAPSSSSSMNDAEIAQAQASGDTVISNGQIVRLQPAAGVNEKIAGLATITPRKKTQTVSKRDLLAFFGPLMKPANPSAVQGLSRAPSSSSSSRSRMTAAARIASADSGRAAQEQIPTNPNTGVHQLVISGPVEFTGGIAITNSNDRIVVYREVDEEKLEPAQVWLRDAKYEIFVDQPIGRLVGELRSADGSVLGRGTYDLARLPKLDSNQYRVDKVSMLIGPVPHGISGSTMTAPIASDANPKARVLPVKNAHVQLGQLPFDTISKKDGTFKDDNLVEGSLVIAHADRPGHWGSLAFATVGTSTELPMFTDATVRAIMQAATGSDHENDRNTAIVWGRVTRGGVPVAGARVDFMTADVEPVYFNKMMLPDSTLKATSENGLYAFFPVEPGAHAVQASDGHGVTEPSMFPTDRKTTTQVNLELNVTKSAKLRVYDAFKTDWPLAAEVVTTGRKRGAMVPKSGETKVTFTGGSGQLFLDTDGGHAYERVRITVSKSQKKIDIPMVQSVWIDRIKGARRVNSDAHTGTVVGFIRGAAAYQVSLENESIGPNTSILYFDAHGELTAKNYGEAGGGFLMLNVPQGFRTVLIQPSGNSKPLASAVLVEDSVTNVINKTF